MAGVKREWGSRSNGNNLAAEAPLPACTQYSLLLTVDARVPDVVFVKRVHVPAARDVAAPPVLPHAFGGAGAYLVGRVNVAEVPALLLGGAGGGRRLLLSLLILGAEDKGGPGQKMRRGDQGSRKNRM